MRQSSFNLLFLLVGSVVIFCFGQKIEVTDNLAGLFHDLHDESFHSATIISPFITGWDILQVSAKKDKKIFVITQRKNIKDYIQYVKSRENFTVYTAKKLHSKIFLMLDKNGGMRGYIGSANFTRNSADNNELVLVVSNPEEIPGFIPFIKALFQQSLFHESVPQEERLLPDIFSKKVVKSSRATERGEPVGVELVSYFDFHTDSDYDLILWIANRIKIEENRDYLISSMTFNYPAFIGKIKKAVKKGSTFKVLVDKESLLKDPSKHYALIDLIRFAKDHSQNISVHWISGRGGTKTSKHHAKLLVRRSTSETKKDGITIVSTANFTKTGGKNYNSALVLPHASIDSALTQRLAQQFHFWWNTSEQIPLEELEKVIRLKTKFCRTRSAPVIRDTADERVVPVRSSSEVMERDRSFTSAEKMHRLKTRE